LQGAGPYNPFSFGISNITPTGLPPEGDSTHSGDPLTRRVHDDTSYKVKR
jgi:hypothetical protein